VGDPINAVKIFNDLEADELVFLDITASKENRIPSLDVIKKIGDEAFMPFAVGGGIKTTEQALQILNAGAEKVVINKAAVENPGLITELADCFGNQSIIVSIDVKKNFWGKTRVFIQNGSISTSLDPIEHAMNMEKLGAGEIIINSIEHDGCMNGYDLDLIKAVSQAVSIPVIAIGGAGKLIHFREATQTANASAVAAGSMFVFHGPRRAVLINYPEKKELFSIFS